MPEYRIYCLDTAGRIRDATVVDQHGDADALAAARAITPAGRQAEVWQLARLVGRVEGARARTTVFPVADARPAAPAPT